MKNKKILYVILGLALILFIGGLIYLGVNNKNKEINALETEI